MINHIFLSLISTATAIKATAITTRDWRYNINAEEEPDLTQEHKGERKSGIRIRQPCRVQTDSKNGML